jgi:hypothetical protein
MIQIMIKFQVKTQNLAKSTHIEDFMFIQQWLTKNMWSIRKLYVFFIATCKNNSFKNSFIWKNEKLLKRTHSSFVK